jgi:hypothetical protein
LTLHVNMGYNLCMSGEILSFILRIGIIACFWAFIWGILKPKGQFMRILRAGLLVLCLLGILVVLRVTGS